MQPVLRSSYRRQLPAESVNPYKPPAPLATVSTVKDYQEDISTPVLNIKMPLPSPMLGPANTEKHVSAHKELRLQRAKVDGAMACLEVLTPYTYSDYDSDQS